MITCLHVTFPNEASVRTTPLFGILKSAKMLSQKNDNRAITDSDFRVLYLSPDPTNPDLFGISYNLLRDYINPVVSKPAPIQALVLD